MSELQTEAGGAVHAPSPYRGAIVAFVVLATVPIGYLGNEGVAPLAALGGLLLAPLAVRDFIAAPAMPPAGVFILAALTAWAAASFAWSPLEARQLSDLHGYDHLQALTAPKLVLQFVLYGAFLMAALRVTATWRRRALWGLSALVVIIVAILLVEGIEGGRFYALLSDMVRRHWPPDLARRNAARGCYGAVVLFWPAAAVLWRRSAAGVAALFVAAAVGAGMLGVDSPILALLLGLGAFVAVSQFGRLGLWACLVASVAYFLAAPFPFLAQGASAAALPADIGKLSWRMRLDIWRFASERILQHPLLGWGLDSSRAWPDQIPMHPHDSALQLWLETGIVGATLGALFFGWLFARISGVEARDRGAAAVMAATAAAYLTIGAVSFGVWQEWWLALGVVALAACALVARWRGETAEDWGAQDLKPLAPPLAPEPPPSPPARAGSQGPVSRPLPAGMGG